MQTSGYSRGLQIYYLASRKIVILRKQFIRILIGLSWLRIGSIAGFHIYNNERSVFIKGVNSWNT
jgi:hypothetical protein